MAVEDILKRIEEETESACNAILSEAEEEAGKITSRYEEEARKLKESLLEKARARADEEEKRLVVNEQLVLRKAILAKKGEVLKKVYDMAKERIKALPENEYIEIISNLVLKNAVSGREELVVPAKQKQLFDDSFLARLNKAFGEGARFSVSAEGGGFEWGVLLREKQREVNLTLDVLFDQVIEVVEPRIAEELFGGDQGE